MAFDMQFCFILKNVGSNLDKNHYVIRLKFFLKFLKKHTQNYLEKIKKSKQVLKKYIKKKKCFHLLVGDI